MTNRQQRRRAERAKATAIIPKNIQEPSVRDLLANWRAAAKSGEMARVAPAVYALVRHKRVQGWFLAVSATVVAMTVIAVTQWVF